MKINEISFPFVGNNLAIDFLNTQCADREEIIELLNEPQDLYSWATEAGITVDDSVMNRDLGDSLKFRQALKEVFLAVLDLQIVPKRSLKIVNKYLLHDLSEQQLVSLKGKLEIQPIQRKHSLERLLGQIANEAALLLVSEKIDKIRRCSNQKCILLFLDTSKSGKRRWCSMNVCGNRSKAANHYVNSKQA